MISFAWLFSSSVTVVEECGAGCVAVDAGGTEEAEGG